MCHPCAFAVGLLPLLKPWLLEEVSGTCIWGVAKNLHSPCNTTSKERLADSEDGIAGGGFHIFCSQSRILRQWHQSSSSWFLIIYIQWRCLTIHRVPLCNHCPWIRRFLFAILLQPGGAICLRNHGSLGFWRGTQKQPQGERQRQTERHAATERQREQGKEHRGVRQNKRITARPRRCHAEVVALLPGLWCPLQGCILKDNDGWATERQQKPTASASCRCLP